ncbi:MAG: hypothetical protein IJV93_00545 [Lentisphaeria bacterium]|nr:hypothetical protein [Lentisphaeria bacterium]
MIRRFYFNMIEIILAISIIAIGISSVMVLFTSGLRSGNDAVQMNSVPDAVESILTHVRQRAAAEASSNSWGAIQTLFPLLNSGSWGNEAGVSLAAFGTALDTNENSIVSANGGRDLLYRQLVVTEVDGTGVPIRYSHTFSAIAEVRSIQPADIMLTHPHDPQRNDLQTAGGAGAVDLRDADSQNAQNLCRRVVEVRISYPADVEMAARESKIYRIEIFNDKYNRFLP